MPQDFYVLIEYIYTLSISKFFLKFRLNKILAHLHCHPQHPPSVYRSFSLPFCNSSISHRSHSFILDFLFAFAFSAALPFSLNLAMASHYKAFFFATKGKSRDRFRIELQFGLICKVEISPRTLFFF